MKRFALWIVVLPLGAAGCGDSDIMDPSDVISLVLAVLAFAVSFISGTILFNRQKRFEARMTAKAAQLANLHQKRAEIVGNLYGKLNSTLEKCNSAMSLLFIPTGQEPTNERISDFAKSFNEASDYFARYEIWLSEQTCKQVVELMDVMKQPMSKISKLIQSPQKIVDTQNIWLDELRIFEKKAPVALATIKDEFRHILGVTDVDDRDKEKCRDSRDK